MLIKISSMCSVCSTVFDDSADTICYGGRGYRGVFQVIALDESWVPTTETRNIVY
jgi:hypothetical protein